MHERQRDPFFEQLRNDILEGVAAADRGELIPAQEVWRRFGITLEEPRIKGPDFEL